MAYFVRRLLENTANESFLRDAFAEGADVEELIAPPAPSAGFDEPPPHLPVVDPTDPAAPGPFANMPHADFARLESRRAALAGAAPGRAAGRRATNRCSSTGASGAAWAPLASVDPARPARVVGRSTSPGRAEAEAAVQAAAPGLSRLARRAGARARRRPVQGRRDHARRARRARRARDARGRQDHPRGRRRRRRGDRLPRVLRPRDAAPRRAAAHGATCPASSTTTPTSRAAWRP